MHTRSQVKAPAFTLIEILVVITIIVILIGILLPALSGASRAARGAKTLAIMRSVADAVDSFQVAQRRLPGRFSQTDMGANENADSVGLTQMESALLDIAGGVVEKSGSNTPAKDNLFRDVGPFSDDAKNVRVDLSLVGNKNQGGYLSFDSDTLTGAFGQTGGGKYTGSADVAPSPRDMLDVLDAFNTPILMFTRDLGGPKTIKTAQDFARVRSDDGKALFYWNTNAGMLAAGSVNGSNHTQSSASAIGSEIEEDQRERNLVAVLGSPAFPTPNDLSLPAQPRGSVVLISAGKDDAYVGLPGDITMKFLGYGPRKMVPGMPGQGGKTVDELDDIFLSAGG